MSARGHEKMDCTVRQLRWKRRSIVERRRRQRRLLAAGGALAFALGTATTVASFSGTDLAEAAAARAQSLAQLMGQRSPGARTAAQLTKTKGIHKALAQQAPEVSPVPANLAEVIAPPVAEIVPVDLGPPPQLALLEMRALPVLLMTPPGGGQKVPPGGGGGACCGGPPNSPPVQPPNSPPPPPLPEPATWMTMLIGFGLIGWAMRRNNGRTNARALS